MTKTPEDSSTELEPYKTSDTPFAAYLVMCGMKLVGSVQDPNDYKREVVVFVSDTIIPDLEEDWKTSKAQGNLKTYHRSLKIVNRYINEARRKRETDGK